MTNSDDLRRQIDEIDQEILNKIEDRFKLTQALAHLKIGKPIRDKIREKEIHQLWQNTRKISSKKFITQVVKILLKESRRIQKEIIKEFKK